MTFDDLAAWAVAALPGVERGTSWNTPALKLRGKMLVRLREDGATLVLPMPIDERDHMIELDPTVFHLTDHYRPWPMVLVHLAAIDPDQLKHRIERLWEARATKAQRAERDYLEHRTP